MLEDYSNTDIVEYIEDDNLSINDNLSSNNIKSQKTSINLFTNVNNDMVISLNICEDILKKINNNNNINVQFTLSRDFIVDLLKLHYN